MFSRFGYPEIILTDNGTQFTGGRWRKACERLGTEDFHTGIYHPRANPVERRNQELKNGLKIRLQGKSHRQWAKQLQAVLLDLRTRMNAATSYYPAEALLSYKLRIASDWKLHPDKAPETPDHPHRDERFQDIRQHQLLSIRRHDGSEADNNISWVIHLWS